MYLLNTFACAGCDNKIIFFKAEFNGFELIVFLLLKWLPYQGLKSLVCSTIYL